MISILLTICSSVILFFICRWYYRKNIVEPEKRAGIAKAGPESNYNRDYCNLLNSITHARNSWELRMARRAVGKFRKRYKDRSSFLEKDSQSLIDAIDHRGVILEMSPSIMN